MAHFKHIIIGSGQAGVPLAHFLASRNESVLIIEKSKVGGTCLNTGCTPSKTMHEAIRKIHHAKNSQYAGFTIDEARFDFNKLMTHVRNLRDSWSEGSEKSLEENQHITLINGHAQFRDSHSVIISRYSGTEEIHSGDNIYINTGGRPRIPEIEGIEKIQPLTNQNIFELTEQPESLLIIGGGYIGLEFAQMFTRLGTEVHIVNHSSKIIGREDDDMIELMVEMLEKEGIHIHNEATPMAVEKTDDGISLSLKNGETLKAEKILIAAGRIPNTDKLALENTKVNPNDRGIIEVNEVLQTREEHIFALGEVAGTPQFTHMSYDDFRIVKANIEKPKVRNNLHRTVPYTLFTDPQLASFGLNEKSAKKKGIHYKLYEMPMEKVARAAEKNEPFGKLKVLCHPQTEEILGATIIGVDAGEMMTVLQMAFSGGITAPQLQEYIFAHPLLAEGFNNLFSA